MIDYGLLPEGLPFLCGMRTERTVMQYIAHEQMATECNFIFVLSEGYSTILDASLHPIFI